MCNMIHVEVYVFQSDGAQLTPVRLNRWYKFTYENLFAVTSLLLFFLSELSAKLHLLEPYGVI